MTLRARVELTDANGDVFVWEWEDVPNVVTYLRAVAMEIIEQFGEKPSLTIHPEIERSHPCGFPHPGD
jgi:hypothetical protein